MINIAILLVILLCKQLLYQLVYWGGLLSLPSLFCIVRGILHILVDMVILTVEMKVPLNLICKALAAKILHRKHTTKVCQNIQWCCLRAAINIGRVCVIKRRRHGCGAVSHSNGPL